MIFSLNKATSLFTERNRPIFVWLSNMRISGKVVPVGQNHQRTPVDRSMFGLLVSNDATRERCL